jgi:hypothetical protein
MLFYYFLLRRARSVWKILIFHNVRATTEKASFTISVFLQNLYIFKVNTDGPLNPLSLSTENQ